MSQIVMVEGLWHTGKSYFLDHVKTISKSSNLLVFDNLRSLGSVRHSAYLIYPSLYSDKNQIYDRSPITLKVLSSLGRAYKHESISPTYWEKFYSEWENQIESNNTQVSVIYFRPFELPSRKIQSSILDYVKSYDKPDLLVDPSYFSESSLNYIHDLFMSEIVKLTSKYKPKFSYHQVEYRDANEAVDILKYLGVLATRGSAVNG